VFIVGMIKTIIFMVIFQSKRIIFYLIVKFDIVTLEPINIHKGDCH